MQIRAHGLKADGSKVELNKVVEVYYATYDKSVLQWNRFVKDFCEDEAAKTFNERLKAAAALWKIARESDMKKAYSHNLFEKYKDDIGQVDY